MKRSLFQLMASLLVLAMMLCALGSCTDETTSQSESSTDVSVEESVEDTSSEEIVYKADLPSTLDFNGEDFIILSSYGSDPSSVDYPFFGGNGEFESSVVNDAVMNRNLAVEELLKVRIVENMMHDSNRYGGGSLHTKVSTAVNTDAVDFDMVSASLYNCAKMTAAGLLQDLVTIEYLHELSEPWWSEAFNSEIEMDGSIYYTSGDISFANIAGTFCLAFNKTVQKDYDIPDLYQLVKDKKWTFDEYFTQGKKINEDLDSNGRWNYNDKIGIVGQTSMMWAMMYSGGERIARPGDDGYPVITVYSERNVSLIKDAINVLGNKETFLSANDYFNESNSPMDLIFQNFFNNYSLFVGVAITNIATVLKDMPDDFGVLPYPMYDETQDDYYSLISPWTGNAVCVPALLADDKLEKIGAVMEAMGAEGKNYITNAYFETTLKEQKTRDEDSIAMLDLINRTSGCDIGQAYQWGGLPVQFQQMVRNNNSNFTQIYDSLKSKVEAELQATIESLKQIK